jgi:N4-gp56 family major capsid protein
MAGQKWSVSADGGFFANTQLSKELRHAAQPMMKARQFVRPESGLGKGRGDTLLFDKVKNIATAGGTISEANRIPESRFTITQSSLVMEEYGNSIPYTGKLETLSEFNITNPIQRALRDDMAKVLDKAVIDVMKTADVIYIPTSSTAGTWDIDGTASTAATANLSVFHVKEIVDAMKVGAYGTNTGYNPVPGFDGENYVCLASVKALRGIKDDPDWEEAVKYGDPERLFTGEVGRIYGVRFVETNHVNALSNGVGTSNVLGEAIFLGSEPVIEAVAVAEELRSKIPGDFGRDKGIAWYALLGFARTWDLTDDSESHIVRVTSS